MENNKTKEFPEEAAAQLIPHLSEGIYTTFPKALKELIINSFDADASEVKIEIAADFKSINIKDDGCGMTSDQFKTEFIRVAGSKKRIGTKNRKYNRPMIGRFGVGFLSVARMCKTARVYSKVAGQTKVIVREIPFDHLFNAANQLKTLKNEYYFYSLDDQVGGSEESFTKIELLDLRSEIENDLKNTKKIAEWNSVDELFGIEKLRLELGILLPVKYHKNYPVYKSNIGYIDDAKKQLNEFNFKVLLNGDEIFRPIYQGKKFFKTGKWNYDNNLIPKNEFSVLAVVNPPGARVKFNGYIYNQSKQIVPAVTRGIILRINNIGIKGFSRSLFEYVKNIGPITSAISGEIFLDSTFEDVLTLDKDNFKEDHPLFKELVSYIHSSMDEVASISRKRSVTKKGKKTDKKFKVKDLNLKSESIKKAKKIMGKKAFAKQYFPNQDITLKTSIGQLKNRISSLIGKSLTNEEGSYLLESVNCFEAKCFRGAIIMAWNTGMYRIHRKIEKDIGFTSFQQNIVDMRADIKIQKYIKSKLKDCTNFDELKLYSEEMICRICEKIQLFDSTNAQILYKSLITLRNNCAHPTGYGAADGDAVFMIQSILDKVLNNSKLKVNNS